MVIYKVTNKINDKIYIGKTKYTIDIRKNQHYKIKRKTKFSQALDEFNKSDFIWEVIDESDNNCELNNKEKYYIKLFDSRVNGYNTALGGEGGDTRSGQKSSEEHIRKISEKLKNHKISFETRSKISDKLKKNFKDNPPFNKSELDDIILMYKDGESLRSISYKYHTDHHKIKRIIDNFS